MPEERVYVRRADKANSTRGNDRRVRLSDELIKGFADEAITFAGSGFQSFAVKDGNPAALATDETGSLQSAGDNADSRSSRANHAGKNFLSQL